MKMIYPIDDVHLNCQEDYDCSSKIFNSYCNKTSCVCDRGHKYYPKLNKCIFSNHFYCTNSTQCAKLDFRLTCLDNYCTCRDKLNRADNYLCSSFRKYCYTGYRYNVETTDCVFVGDLTLRELENLDQNVEMFVIALFFITSALFIASCINNYKNERAEKLRRRIAQQQTMSLFSEQSINYRNDRLDRIHNLNDINFTSNNFPGYNQATSTNQSNRLPYNKKKFNGSSYEDLPPTYEEAIASAKYNSLTIFNPNSTMNLNSIEINSSNNTDSNNNNLENNAIDKATTSNNTNQNDANLKDNLVVTNVDKSIEKKQ